MHEAKHDASFTPVAAPLSDADKDWLHIFQGDWQVLADLAQADLLLWQRAADGGFYCSANCRPASGPTIHLDDVVGLRLPPAREDLMSHVFSTGQITSNPVRRWTGMNTVTEELIPVVSNNRVLAVVTKETNLAFASGVLGGKGWMLRVSDILCKMVANGDFPYGATPSMGHGVPRAVDGAILLDAEGTVTHASPNAISAVRRLGVNSPLVGQVLAEPITDLMQTHSQVDETLPVVIMGRASWASEVETPDAIVTFRAMPLTENRQRVGALLLCRDVTDRRLRERQLMSKDATIREIHHRVKNNLQTVSALLRLQARRSDSSEVMTALGEAQRRVAAIATVHEALSQTVDESVSFDAVMGKVLKLAGGAASKGGGVNIIVEGHVGPVGADSAAALAVVLTELVTNAVEHGLREGAGTVKVRSLRSEGELQVTVCDDGVGIAPGQAISGLGTQIVQTLVQSQLGGSITWAPNSNGKSGTTVTLHATKLM